MNSKYDFTHDTRQSPIAILQLIWQYYKIAFRQFIAVFALLAIKSSALILWSIAIGISVIVFVLAFLAYMRFKFRLENNELIISKGVFKKVKLNIPFERIQTINFEQNLVLQLFEKYKVEVDTAGSAKKEFSFDALDKQIAQELRQVILERKQVIAKEIADNQDSELEIYEEDLEVETEASLFELNEKELFKIGLTENHIKAGAWVIFIFGYLFSTANEAGLKIEDRIEDSKIFENFQPSIKFLFILIPVITFVLVAISIVRVFLKYYNLKFIRIAQGFKIYSGLLNRKEFSAPDHKIQKISWGDNPLRRRFGIFILWLKQASSAETNQNKSFTIPINSKQKIEDILHELYGDKMDKELFDFPISKLYFYRHFIYFILPIFLVGISLGIYFHYIILIVSSFLFLLYFSISTWVQFKKSRFSFNDYFLQRNKGIYGDFTEIVPWYKIQAVDIIQSIYQRRRDLASVSFHTAAGDISIPYIRLEQARMLRDLALYKAESSSEEWM